MRVIVEQLVEWRLAGETEVLGENLPQRHFVHHKSHMTRPGLEPRATAVGSQWITAWAMARSLTRHGSLRKLGVKQFFYCCVFVAAVTFLPSRCLVTIAGYTYRHTDWQRDLWCTPLRWGSSAMIYMPSFIKICSGIQRLIHTDSMVIA
jgi:hypothetical protein